MSDSKKLPKPEELQTPPPGEVETSGQMVTDAANAPTVDAPFGRGRTEEDEKNLQEAAAEAEAEATKE